MVEETDEYVVFEHRPARSSASPSRCCGPGWRRTYGDQRQADAAWKERVEALAAALRLDHDQACTDTSRLFFLPRRPPDGPPPETAVLDGAPCDLFALPRADRRQARPARTRGASRGAGARADGSTPIADPETGEVFDLPAWARRYGRPLRDRQGAAGPPARGLRRQGQRTRSSTTSAAPTRTEHTQAGVDAATFVVNASEQSETGASSTTAGTPTATAATGWSSCGRMLEQRLA